ncbi:MAG: hypothetical protein RLZZ161_1160 [Bacteroidota bacterium]
MSRTRKYLPEWVSEGIISSEQQTEIEQWLAARQGRLPGMIFWVSLLAGILVGLGVLLIIAHNWDDLPHFGRMILSLLPALIGTSLMLFAAFRRYENAVWMELGSLLQMIGLGASIALVSQVYHVYGSMESYLFAWLLVFTPTQLLLCGRLSLLLYLILSTWFVCAAGYNYSPDVEPLHVGWMLLVMVYSVRNLYSEQKSVLLLLPYSWLFPLCFGLGFGTLAFNGKHPELLFLGYAAVLGWFIVLGESIKTQNDRYRWKGLRIFGRMGLLILFSLFSYKFFWKQVIQDELFKVRSPFVTSPLFWIAVILLAGLLAYSFLQTNRRGIIFRSPELIAIALFGIAFFLLGRYFPLAGMVLTNLMMLGLGIYYLQKGISGKSLLWLNYGLLWLAVLLICRFSDMSQGYLARGLFFIGVGTLLFIVNVFVIRKRGKEQGHVG